jgi:prepilin-type N-terminal cleavage/methylation domain-containing protein
MILCLLSSHKKSSGFTLIEILLAISLIGILSAVGITLISGSVDESRYDSTLREIREIRKALIGDPESMQGGFRSSFGYVGDLGSVPNATQGLNALLNLPAGGSSWSMNTSARFRLGWNVPYLSTTVTGEIALLDSWCRSYVYSPRPPTKITSCGADGVAGGSGFNQDVVVSIPNEQILATLYGFISSGGVALSGASQVEIFFPNGSGILPSTLVRVASGTQGAFQFNNIPMGYRSLTVFVPSKASPTQTLAPISFTLDKSRFLVPTNLVDTNPSGTGTGTGGNNNSDCNTSSGKVILAAGSTSTIGSTLSLTVNPTGNVDVSGFKMKMPSAAIANQITLIGTTYQSTGGNAFTPCPLTIGIQASLSSVRKLSRNGRSISIGFSSSVTSDTTATLILYHDLGCDRFNMTGNP